MPFPQTRLRRLRRTPVLRDLVRETRLDAGDFVLPLYIQDGLEGRTALPTMPGVDRLSISEAVAEAGEAVALGLPAVILFGIPSHKDEEGSGAWEDEGIVQLATRAIKDAHPDLLVVADLCLCEYTSHGHCGLLRADGSVDNDASLEILARTAISQARAGADVIAPSDMMDGRVGAIRAALDDDGLTDTPILAYSAKFASAFYGPFREAADSTPAFGDRRGCRLHRRAQRRPRGAHVHPPRRRRHRHHLPRQGCRQMASDLTATPKIRSRKGGAAVPLDDFDRRLLNAMQGSFPIVPRPYAAVATGLGVPEERV